MNKQYHDFRNNIAYRTFRGNIYEVTGDSAEEDLNVVLSKNIEFQNIDTASNQYLLDDDGDYAATVLVYKLEDRFLLLSVHDLTDLIDLSSDTKIEDVSSTYTMIQIEGLRSPDIVAKYYEYDISTLGFRDIIKTSFGGEDGLLIRFGYSGEFGYQFLLRAAVKDDFIASELSSVPEYDELLEEFTSFEVGERSADLLESGEYNIFELGVLWNVDATKYEFRGKEKLFEKMAAGDRMAVGFKSDEDITEGEEVFFDKTTIGKVLKAYPDLSEEAKTKGLLLVDRAYATPSISLLVGSHEAETISAPYTIPSSWNVTA
jgi:CylF protein